MTAAAPVVFCFDERYAPYAAVATASLVKTTRCPLQIYWLVRPGDAPAAERWQEELQGPGAHIAIIKVDDGPFSTWRRGNHVTLATYLRLLIPQAVAAPKALYLDCDVLVTGDLSPLLTADLRGAVLAGAVDHYFTGAPDRLRPFEPLCRDRYLNAGVMLMDLDQMRRDDLLGKVSDIYEKFPRRIFAHDQCLLNKYAEGRKALLGEQWNFQVPPYVHGKQAWEALIRSGQIAVIHYADAVKPWQQWCSPWVRQGWEAMAREVGLGQSCFERELTLPKAIVLIKALDRTGQYQRSSALKNSLINALLKQLEGEGGGTAIGQVAQTPINLPAG